MMGVPYFVTNHSLLARDPDPAPELTQQAAQYAVTVNNIGFTIPTFSGILTFMIRGFLTIGGVAALFYLMWGAFDWAISQGEKGKIEAAQKKMTSAVIGLVMIVVVLAIAWTLENMVFAQTICFGLTCPVKIPSLVGDPTPTP